MDNRLYLSVLSTAASGGSISYNIETFDANPNVNISGTVSSITTSDTELDIAKKIIDQINSDLLSNSASYAGIPTSLADSPSGTFQLTRTDHCICVWSQSQFDLKLTADSTGSIAIIGTNPVLSTISEAQRYGAVMNQTFSGMTNSQIADLLQLISDEVIAEINNKIIRSTYVVDTWMDDIDGYKLPVIPVVQMDDPKINIPFSILTVRDAVAMDVTSRYIIQTDGWVMYRDAQDLVANFNDPYANGNQWKVTYVAGHSKIPSAVKTAIVKLSPYYTSFSMFQELAGGTSRVKYKDEFVEKQRIMNSLRGLFL